MVVLTDPEKIDARRFMGYPVFGAAPSGNMGWQFYRAAGLVEYRLANLSSAEEDVLRQYLATINALEHSIPEAASGLDTRSAGGWVRNPVELAERSRLFDDWRRRLCAFLGVPAGPEFGGGSSVALVI